MIVECKDTGLVNAITNVASYFAKERLLLDDIRQHMLSLECVSFQVVQTINITMQLKS